MAIDLLNRLTQAQMNTTVSKQVVEAVKNADSAEAARILNTVLSLKAGDTLQGELVSINGKDISLLLGNTVLLSAKMEKELVLTQGQKMSFTVNSNQNGKLSLKPLFANTGMEQNAMKALDAASIPVTDKTLALVEELMRQGMPVNKQSLSAAYRQMGMYPDAEITDLVMLQKMNIPVTEENLSMMRLYQTNQHYLFTDLQGLSSQMADFLSDMVQSQPSDAVQNFIRGFLEIFQNMPDAQAGIGEETQSAESLQANVLQNISDSNVQGETVSHKSHTVEGDKVIIQENVTTEDSILQGKTDAAAKELQLLDLLHGDSSKAEGTRETLAQNIFSMLKEQFLMKPENMQSADYVKEFYEHLNEQVDKLQNLIKSAGKENSPLGKEVSTVKNNIQFMNQINELYHYVQLPIKMNESGANGDLYVYKRKQAKTGEDGKLTALLHLSMPTLGNMDVFLSLEGQKLSTRFCMEKEEMIDFVSSFTWDNNYYREYIRNKYNVDEISALYNIDAGIGIDVLIEGPTKDKFSPFTEIMNRSAGLDEPDCP